jgi:ABC-type transporter Mla MlaB component
LLFFPVEESAMLKITIRTEQTKSTLELVGSLAGPWVEELERFWSKVKVNLKPLPMEVVLSELVFVDAAGKALLARMYGDGADLVGGGCMVRAIVAEIKEGGLYSVGRKRDHLI